MTGEVNHKQGLMPKLRFPEFREADPWPAKPLSALAKRQSKRNSDQKITRVLTNSAEHGIVDQRDYFEKDIATQGNLDAYFVAKQGDYIYNPRISSLAPVGPIGKNNVGKGVVSPLYTVFRFSGDNDSFYEHYFRSNCWHGYLRRVSNSGARHDRMAISNDAFIEMPLPAPSTAEQQKIADCLSSLDALIAAGAEKLTALKDQKKGLIQKLFPADGEISPRLRFPEFRDAGEWQWATVDKIANIYKGKGISKADIAVDAPQLCIRYGELYTSYGEVIDDVISTTSLPKGELFMSKKNDVIIPSSGETKIDIATASCVLHDDIALGGDLNVIRSQQNGIFLSYFFNGPLKFAIAKIAQGDSVVHLYPAQIGSLKVALPSLSEQEKIANAIFSLEQIIIAGKKRLALLKTHKKGLMQQLFPSSVEASA